MKRHEGTDVFMKTRLGQLLRVRKPMCRFIDLSHCRARCAQNIA